MQNVEALAHFARLDDYDIWTAVKLWADSEDWVLRELSNRLLDRNLFKVEISNEEFSAEKIESISKKIITKLKVDKDILPYFLFSGEASNAAYLANTQNINVLKKDGSLSDIADASELPNIKAISKIVKKYYLCYPKNLSL